MRRLTTFIDWCSESTARIAGILLLCLICVILTDVVGRNAFDSGSTQLQELEWHLNACVFLLTLGYAYLRGAHVRIEVLIHRFSARQSALIEILGCLFLAMPYCIALLVFGVDYLAASYAFNEASASATGLPFRWILKGIMVGGFGLLLLAVLSTCLKSLRDVMRADGESMPSARAERVEM